jgi:hypothetical protein
MRTPGFLRRLLGRGRTAEGTQSEGETPYQPIPAFTENPYDLLPADFNERAPAENPYDLLPADFNERAPAENPYDLRPADFNEPEYDPESDPIYNTLPAAALKELIEGPYHTIPPELLAQQNAARLARYGTRPPPPAPPRPKLARYPQTPPPKHVRFRTGLEVGPSGSGNPNRRAAPPARGILRKRRD